MTLARRGRLRLLACSPRRVFFRRRDAPDSGTVRSYTRARIDGGRYPFVILDFVRNGCVEPEQRGSFHPSAGDAIAGSVPGLHFPHPPAKHDRRRRHVGLRGAIRLLEHNPTETRSTLSERLAQPGSGRQDPKALSPGGIEQPVVQAVKCLPGRILFAPRQGGRELEGVGSPEGVHGEKATGRPRFVTMIWPPALIFSRRPLRLVLRSAIPTVFI
jgi:hypothetical protein